MDAALQALVGRIVLAPLAIALELGATMQLWPSESRLASPAMSQSTWTDRSLGRHMCLSTVRLPTTAEVVEAIEAQGWMGQITTQNIGGVAARTLDYALAGRAVYIPGWINRLLQALGSLAPAWLVARLVGMRWKAARQRRTHTPTSGGVKQPAEAFS